MAKRINPNPRSTGGICSVCSHPHLDEINSLLLAKTSYRNITKLYPTLSTAALCRHRKCSGSAILQRLREDERRAESIADEIFRKKQEAEELQSLATAEGDHRAALAAIKVYADLVGLLLRAAELANTGSLASGVVKVTLKLSGHSIAATGEENAS